MLKKKTVLSQVTFYCGYSSTVLLGKAKKISGRAPKKLLGTARQNF